MERFGVRREKRRDQEEGIGGSWERMRDGRTGIQYVRVAKATVWKLKCALLRAEE